MMRCFVNILVLLAMLTGAVACTSSNLDVSTPAIDITLNSAQKIADTFVYHLGDTVTFRINGTAQNLYFYSGQDGNNYDHRTRTLLETVHPYLSFYSQMQYGTQTNTLRVLAIKNLASTDSATAVNAAWTDITDRLTLPAAASTTTFSGSIDLSDIAAKPEDTLYLAFRYSGVTGSNQRTWTITGYSVDNIIPAGTVNIATLATEAGSWSTFGNVAGGNNWSPTTSSLLMTGGAATAPTRTVWLLSRGMPIGKTTPDYSTVLKNIENADLTSYRFVYAAKGLYKAVWIASNITPRDEEKLVKTFYIRIAD